jgi:integrase
MTDAPSVHVSRTCAAQRAAWVIERYASCSVSGAAAAFAREVVAAAAPASPDRAKALLFAASRLAAFGESVGLELCAQALLCEAVIERFAACGTRGLSPATVRTLRSNLRSLARCLEPHPEPLPLPLPRERAKAPYTPAEIEGFLRLAAAQSTHAKRMRCQALICLGAGAGIVSGELRAIRGRDVIARSGGLLVALRAPSEPKRRIVPVLSRYREPLIEAARFAGDGLIIGGREPARKNITDALSAALCADPSLPRLVAGRLRSTWLSEAAKLIGLGAFMAAAGVSCSQRLGDIAATLPAIGESEMVALLGGSS